MNQLKYPAVFTVLLILNPITAYTETVERIQYCKKSTETIKDITDPNECGYWSMTHKSKGTLISLTAEPRTYRLCREIVDLDVPPGSSKILGRIYISVDDNIIMNPQTNLNTLTTEMQPTHFQQGSCVIVQGRKIMVLRNRTGLSSNNQYVQKGLYTPLDNLPGNQVSKQGWTIDGKGSQDAVSNDTTNGIDATTLINIDKPKLTRVCRDNDSHPKDVGMMSMSIDGRNIYGAHPDKIKEEYAYSMVQISQDSCFDVDAKNITLFRYLTPGNTIDYKHSGVFSY